ncbi:Flagellar attachment zone protein 1 [Cercospora beticola]|uniref:Flagellar attachment zone protein 1 n=1 Tax=Cercospora beticola TaxID=122368 RepID=A0A2G5HPB0_CERBT|nr:Flagellar attachment zone protein 1 [Cercospora beticola]PIA94374.1 Flagellar attachment zone protein 1 [Cercospora beticola]WPB04848.1 hypothetical protein RHO25_009495 [Cercospora beticola]
MNDSGILRSASGSFHVSSRPPSRAWSDSTERPESSHSTVVGGPRSISQEIEHIKRLITRAESNRQQISGSITAVVFRNKKQEPVVKEHIFHELDALKRRIKYEQQQAAEKAKEQEHALVRRASQIDPGTESESEVESVLDERDEELEKANEALEIQRERFESLLENAEERVDLLTGQRDALHLEKAHLEETFQRDKDRLERLLNDERNRLQTEKAKLEQELKQERDNRDHVLQSAEERLDRLTEEKEIAKARTNHLVEERDLLKSELEKLATETGKLEADVVREKERLKGELGDTKAQLTRATKEKTSLNNELEATRKWVEELNAKIEDGARSLQEKSKAFDDLRTEKRSTDVAHKSAQEEILRLHALKSDVEASLRDTSAKLSKLERENKDAAAYLEKFTAERSDAEKALQEKLQDAHGRCNSLTAELAQREKLNMDLEQKLSAVETKHETATKHAVDLGLKYKEATKTADELRATHEVELERVRNEGAARLKESEDQHAYESAELKDEYSNQMDQLRKEHAQNLLTSLRTERESAQKEAQVELKGARAAHAEQLRTKSAGLDEVKNSLEELRKKRDDSLEEASSLRNALEVLQQQKGEIEQASRKRLTDTEASHAETMQQERTRTQQQISELQRQLQEKQTAHEQTLISIKSEHEAEVRQLVAKHTEATSAASTAAEQKVSKLEEDHQRTIASLKDVHVAALECKTTEHGKALADLVAEHEQDRQEARARHEEAEAKLRGKLEEATSHSTGTAATHEGALAELRAEYSKELQALRAQHHAQQQAKERDVNDLKEELARAHEEALAKARAEHGDELTRLEAQHHAHQHAKDKIVRDLEEDLSRLRSEHLSAINASREHGEGVKRDLVAEHEKLTQQIRDAHAEELQQARLKWAAEIEDLQTKSATEKDQLRQEVEDALSRVGKAQAAHDALLEDLKTKHSAELEAINASLSDEAARHQQTVAAHDAKLVQLQAEHSEAIGTIKSEHSAHIDAIKTATQESVERDHKAAITKLTQEHEEELARLHERSNKSDRDREMDHHAELAETRQKGESQLEDLRSEHSQAQAAAESMHREALHQLQTGHDQQLKILASQHQQRLDDLRLTLTERQSKREQEFEASKKAAADDIERMRHDNMKALAIARAEGGSTLEARLAEAAAKAQVEITTMKFEHDKALSEAQHELERLRSEHEQALASVRLALEGELDATRNMHRKSVDELQATLKVQLDEAKTSHTRAIAEHDSTWANKLKELQAEHAQSLTELLSNNDASAASKLKELDQLHADAISKAIADARREADEQAAAAEEQHKTALETAVQKARSGSQAEVRNLKKRHQDAMSHIRQAAEKASGTQLQELERVHRKDLELALNEAKEAAERDRNSLLASHEDALTQERARTLEAQRTEMARLTEQHRASFADFEARTRLQRETEGASREAAYKAEVEALQARLDATMTGQAEAERSLAALRQQLVTADKRIADAKSGNEAQIAALVSEKDDLTTQLEQVQSSLRELQRKHSGGSATPRASVAIREEVAELVAQVNTLEEERSTMQAMLKKRQEEKNEVSRQNEFLVKELEMLLQQRSRPRESSRSSSNALVQTEDMPVEPKADMASFTPIKAARRNTSSSRPMTPLSPGVRQARADVEAAWQSRSFEDYLDNARAELSELGSVISANEALFARKIDEHVSGLQRAKDELQADYNAKVAALAKDKDTMEQIISSEQHAQFVKDRKKLIAKYGADFQDPAERSAMLTSLPMDTAVALRTAEQKLVDDYNKRITKRKSQIALKHAEEFQNITRDYDRRVSVLLNTRSRLEGDLSMDPSKFEAAYGDITNKSEQLFAERKSNIGAPRAARKSDDVPILSGHASMQSQSSPHLPFKDLEVDRARPRTRERTSSPRTEQSLPRSSSRPREFFPGSRDSPEATSQPMKARRGSNKHPPVPQHFLMRTKEAADFFAPPRVVSDASPEPNIPRTPRGRPQSRADSRINHSLGYEPSVAESQQAAYADRRIVSLQEKSPSILRKIKDKISPVSSRPSSSSGRPSSSSGNTPSKSNSKSWKPHIHKRSKSRHLSSGMIYYNDPAKHPPPTTYHS